MLFVISAFSRLGMCWLLPKTNAVSAFWHDLAQLVYSFFAGCDISIGYASPWYADGRGFDPHVQQHSFVEIGHQIISTAILSLLLIQEGQLSVTGERMCTKYW